MLNGQVKRELSFACSQRQSLPLGRLGGVKTCLHNLRRCSLSEKRFESVEHRQLLTPLNGSFSQTSGRLSGILLPFSTQGIGPL